MTSSGNYERKAGPMATPVTAISSTCPVSHAVWGDGGPSPLLLAKDHCHNYHNIPAGQGRVVLARRALPQRGSGTKETTAASRPAISQPTVVSPHPVTAQPLSAAAVKVPATHLGPWQLPQGSHAHWSGPWFSPTIDEWEHPAWAKDSSPCLLGCSSWPFWAWLRRFWPGCPSGQDALLARMPFWPGCSSGQGRLLSLHLLGGPWFPPRDSSTQG